MLKLTREPTIEDAALRALMEPLVNAAQAAKFSRVKGLRYTDADQQRLYPGDRCFQPIERPDTSDAAD